MEEETKRKQADLPSNYVTLLELQERWIKEQKRKQRKEQEKQQVEETNTVAVTNQTANSEGVEMTKKKKKKQKNKKKKKSEKEAEEEGKDMPEGQPEPDAKKVQGRHETGHIPARRNVRKNDSKIFRRKVGDVAEETDRSVEIEREQCDDTVEIEQKLENVRVEEESDVSRKEKGGYVGGGNRKNGKFGYHDGDSDRPFRVYSGSYGRHNWQFRGYDRGVRRGNGWNGRGYGRDDRHRMVWVKKEHDAMEVHDRASS